MNLRKLITWVDSLFEPEEETVYDTSDYVNGFVQDRLWGEDNFFYGRSEIGDQDFSLESMDPMDYWIAVEEAEARAEREATEAIQPRTG